MKMNRLSRICRWSGPLVLVSTLLVSGIAKASYQTPETKLRAKLEAQVKEFDNQGKPFIPTLLKIATDYQLPMGIEKAANEALDEPVKVKLANGTVAELLDAAVGKVSGYSWTSDGGSIEVFGVEEFNDPSNL